MEKLLRTKIGEADVDNDRIFTPASDQVQVMRFF